jgi:hypothetical protein
VYYQLSNREEDILLSVSSSLFNYNMKDIKGFEGLYAITEDGRVWGYPNPKRKCGHWLVWRGSGRKYLKSRKDEKRDYKTIALKKDKKSYYFYIHRLVAETYIPNIENKPFVNHIDGNKTNNNVKNLEWCTHRENTKHAFENGLTTRGKLNSQTILTEENVRKIRKLYKFRSKKYNQKELGKMFGVCQGTISVIIQGKNWKWLN